MRVLPLRIPLGGHVGILKTLRNSLRSDAAVAAESRSVSERKHGQGPPGDDPVVHDRILAQRRPGARLDARVGESLDARVGESVYFHVRSPLAVNVLIRP